MIQNSTEVQYCLLAFFITVAGYNVCGILVTKLGSSMWHTILDNFRPVSVWVTSLLMYYVVYHEEKMGAEPWTWASWFELGGMAVLLLGSAIYQGKIKLSCFNYDEPAGPDVMATVTPQLVACSPALTPQLRFERGELQYFSPSLAPRDTWTGTVYQAPLLQENTDEVKSPPLETA